MIRRPAVERTAPRASRQHVPAAFTVACDGVGCRSRLAAAFDEIARLWQQLLRHADAGRFREATPPAPPLEPDSLSAPPTEPKAYAPDPPGKPAPPEEPPPEQVVVAEYRERSHVDVIA